MTYNIALQFEDGVSRVSRASPTNWSPTRPTRQDQHPVDCRDGACGTCKCHCESGSFTMGDYIEDALADDEAADGYVLTCQMRPTSDCVVRVPASSAACKTEVGTHGGKLAVVDRDSETTVSFTLQAEHPLAFLPGQYVNLTVPGSKEARSYSFSSAPNSSELSFPDPRCPTDS
jgi:benzoate/toluate 1,2-dioxygenase reductase subunit